MVQLFTCHCTSNRDFQSEVATLRQHAILGWTRGGLNLKRLISQLLHFLHMLLIYVLQGKPLFEMCWFYMGGHCQNCCRPPPCQTGKRGKKCPKPSWQALSHPGNVGKQDPVSTMKKTGWTIHSSFLVLCGLEKGFTLDPITRGQSTTLFVCVGPFLA